MEKNFEFIKYKKKIKIILLIFSSFLIIIVYKVFHRNNNKNLKYLEYNLKSSKDFNNPLDYENNAFVILRDIHCSFFLWITLFLFSLFGMLTFVFI